MCDEEGSEYRVDNHGRTYIPLGWLTIFDEQKDGKKTNKLKIFHNVVAAADATTYSIHMKS